MWMVEIGARSAHTHATAPIFTKTHTHTHCIYISWFDITTTFASVSVTTVTPTLVALVRYSRICDVVLPFRCYSIFNFITTCALSKDLPRICGSSIVCGALRIATTTATTLCTVWRLSAAHTNTHTQVELKLLDWTHCHIQIERLTATKWNGFFSFFFFLLLYLRIPARAHHHENTQHHRLSIVNNIFPSFLFLSLSCCVEGWGDATIRCHSINFALEYFIEFNKSGSFRSNRK